MANATAPVIAVVLTCHGTVERLEDLPAFLRNIRRGQPVSEALVEEVTSRYRQIGGSPYLRITHEQAAALEQRLGVPVRAAARLWHPYPKEVITGLAAEGVTELVSIPLAPQSVHIYHPDVVEAARTHGLNVRQAGPWGDEPMLVDAFVEAIEEALARVPAERRASTPVLLTAHSLPLRAIEAGDPYERDFRDMASRVAERLGASRCSVAFQSQGMSGGAWLGPDLATAFAALAAAGAQEVVVAPIGFLAEHVETLYDIDIEGRALAAEAGLSRLWRMPPMNTRPRFLDALEAVARRLLAR